MTVKYESLDEIHEIQRKHYDARKHLGWEEKRGLIEKKTGDFLVVALENDAFIHMQKKRKPFHTLQERIAILQEIRTVDSVISLPLLSGYEDYLKLVKAIHPSIIAVTENDPYLSQKSKQARAIQAQVKIVIGRIPQHATTSILKQL